jgi:uncharacterized protein YegL
MAQMISIKAQTEFQRYPRTVRDIWALLTLSAPDSAVPAGVATRVLVVLDRSASMAEDHKLTLAKRVVTRLLDVAAASVAGMHVGLIAFDDETCVTLPLALRTTTEEHEAAKATVDALETGGGTNIEEALRLAAQLAGTAGGAGPMIVLLLTDGQPQSGLGIATPAEQQELVRVWTDANAPAAFYTFGLGSDHKAEFLAALATAGSGTYTYIAKARWIGRELGAVLGQAAAQLTDHTGVLVQVPRATQIGATYTTTPRTTGAGGLEFRVPVFAAGQTLAVPVRLNGVPAPLALDVTMSYTTMAGAHVLVAATLTIAAAADSDDVEGAALPELVLHRLRFQVAELLAQHSPPLPALHTLRAVVEAAIAATAAPPDPLYHALLRQLDAAIASVESGEHEADRLSRQAYSHGLQMQSGALLFGHSMGDHSRLMSQQLDVPLDRDTTDSIAPHGGKLRHTRVTPLSGGGGIQRRLDFPSNAEDDEDVEQSQVSQSY